MAKAYEIDFTKGPLLKKMIIYALPIIGVNILQLFFTAADVAVLGIFTNDRAVAAVGATSQIVNLMIGFFVGLSVGANVLVARAVGARNEVRASRLVGTSIILSIVFGLVIMVAGVLMAETILVWTKCDPLVLPYAVKYLQIYFLGMPIIMLYNFSAAILRAVGDTLRPLIFLAVGGFANIFLNIFFILVVGLDVEGVAIATVASNAVSAAGALMIMLKNKGYAKISKSTLKIYREELLDIFLIGLPLGLSKCTFSLANTIIYSSINELGEFVMAANSIAKEIDGFILEALHGISLASLAVISQNLGAGKAARIKKTVFLSLGLVLGVGAALGITLYFTGAALCGIMTETSIVVEYAMVRLLIVGVPYVICGVVNVLLESIRGLGYSTTALIISMISNIGFRLLWLWLVYPNISVPGDVEGNYAKICLVWPASWVLTIVMATVVLVWAYKKVKTKININNSKENNYVKT